MQRLFFGIYGAILASTLLLLALSYFALNSVNQYRYQTHLSSVMQGTVHLLSLGIARQGSEDKQRWINLAASLLDADLKVVAAQPGKTENYLVTPVLLDNGNSGKYLIKAQLPERQQEIVLEFEGVTEAMLSATAFFMLNELGRTPPDERQKVFDDIKSKFSYPIFRTSQADLDIDSRQLERLQRGETVVTVKRQFGQELAFNIYAPWGKTSDALVLGPVSFFDPFPTYIAASVLSSALVFMAVLVMLLIRKLGKRLMALQDKVDSIGSKHVPTAQNEQNSEGNNAEVITGLSNKIQNMSQRIEKLLAEKAYMIRAVSHDLRTPIAKIHFRLEALIEQVDPQNKAIQGIQGDLRQLNLLIDELLTYEKLSEKQTIDFDTLQLSPLIHEQIEDIRLIYPEIRFHLDTTNCENEGCENEDGNNINGEIEANDILLKRLFENLLNNAGRYANSEVSVTVISQKDRASIVIDDDGPGLGNVDHKQLFDPFYKADASRTSGKGGYGLGLSIVKQVAMQHNGNIEAANNSRGGARFTLTLPVKQVHP